MSVTRSHILQSHGLGKESLGIAPFSGAGQPAMRTFGVFLPSVRPPSWDPRIHVARAVAPLLHEKERD